MLAVLYLVIALLYYTLVLCCAVPILTAPALFYVVLVGAAVFGRAYRESFEMAMDGGDRRAL